ncbi:MAG TPA: hypothetical protein VHV51_18300 [Polyangiaceae bacterium]|jgi:hypothetical protein|nr:hypothetical protein [Polyangiaceae bacterium]
MLLARALGLGSVVCCVVASCGGSATDSQHNSGGASGAGAGGAIEAGFAGESSAAGAATAGTSDASAAGSPSAGSGGDAGAGGEAGAGGAPGEPITDGLIVVGTTTQGAAPKHYLVLLDPADGHEIARTELSLSVLAIEYEAARDKWFVFTALGPTSSVGSLLVGSMTTTGFSIEQTASVTKPTNQNTIAVLNQRILYRTGTHLGASLDDDEFALLDTSGAVKQIGTLTIPYRYALVSAAGAPSRGPSAGGRVFFLHDNLDDINENCAEPDAGSEEACTVYESSLSVGALDTALTFSLDAVTPLAQIDRDGSDGALGVQPSGGQNAAIVLPPRRQVDTHASIFLFDANTGAALAPTLKFSLETATKKLDPSNSITIPTVALDPCADRLFTGELANAALLYSVPFAAPDSVVAFSPASADNIVGTVVYEPFTNTLISFNSDPATPSFSGLQISGTVAAPQIARRGMPGATPWLVPPGLVPEAVALKNPQTAPCGD